MAGLFDQYEQAAQKSADFFTTARNPKPERLATNLISLAVEDNEPIFNRRRINFKPPSPITCMTARNGLLVLSMMNKVILRLNLTQHDPTPDEIDLLKSSGNQYLQAKVRRLFLDFTGNHLLIAITGRDGESPVDLVYLHKNSKKPKSIIKMKSHSISAVGWDAQNRSEVSSGSILLGTDKGLIWETCLNAPDEKYSHANVDVYWKQVFDLGRDGPTLITGIEYQRDPAGGDKPKCFILVTTPSRLYQFLGSIPSLTDFPVLVHVFNNYPDLPARYQDIPSHLPYSQLELFYPAPWSLPKAFSWMIDAGVLCGGLDYSGSVGIDSVTTETKLISYPKQEVSQPPLAIVLTEFHVLVLYPDRVKGICVLNEQLVFEDVYTETYGNMVTIVKDPASSTIWVCMEYAIYKYNVKRESRHVWQVYLDLGEYSLAKQYSENDPAALDIVLTRQADDYFNQKKYKESAVIYAKTHVSFEEVALKFLQANIKSALQEYLLLKISSLKSEEKTQQTMIVTWIVELYLTQLDELKNNSNYDKGVYGDLENKFYAFLEDVRVIECVTKNSGAIFDLITNHGNQRAVVHFATLIKDYEKVVQFHIYNGNYAGALEVLKKQASFICLRQVDLFYQFCSVLMQFIPHEVINVCIELGRYLKPAKLIPALVHYNQNIDSHIRDNNEAVRYLEFCIKTLDEKDPTIHNYLLSLFAKYFPENLKQYLDSQGQDPAVISYDLEYALRICSECNLDWACVHIYAMMNLYEEAVDLALKFDVQLAKQNADKPEGNEELKKKLWLKIAKHVVQEENDIGKAMEFLQECDFLKIEDILPFFPNFVTIDHFKDAICQSLQEYNHNLELLKEEMEEATESTNEIRSEIQDFRNKSVTVRSQDKCSACSYPVLTRSFYSFPCQHFFHIECLSLEVIPYLNNMRKQKLDDLQKQLNNMSLTREDVGSISSFSSNSTSLNIPSAREQIKVEMDDILAAECPYCGEQMIKSIDAPFMTSEEIEKEKISWE
ncbi:Vacuolar protein sorting-associated protein 18 like protein [Chamberlinius hualienensis]